MPLDGGIFSIQDSLPKYISVCVELTKCKQHSLLVQGQSVRAEGGGWVWVPLPDLEPGPCPVDGGLMVNQLEYKVGSYPIPVPQS